MAQPNWSTKVATPASFGTPEAKQANEKTFDSGSGQPQWGQQVEPGVSWSTLTGQNMEGPNNAFDTDFWNTATQQDKESQTQGLGERWTRPDATGVVVYNDPSKGLKFGDVYANGELQGNLRDGYAGVTRDQGNEMLARLTLPREVWAKSYEQQAGKPLTAAQDLDKEIARVEKENTENYSKGLSAQSFQSDVKERTEDLQDSGLAQAGNVAAGAAGGAAVGAGIGSVVPVIGTGIGAVAGGLIGGIGAWFNRDEQMQSLAQAQEQYERATSDGHQAVGVFDAASGYAGYAASQLNPITNLFRGGREALAGQDGDAEAERLTTNQGLGVTALDTAALLADGIGSFGTGIARALFTATMGAGAAGDVGSVVTGATDGNVAFNPYAGRYEDIGAAGMVQQAAAAGIDVGQTFLGAAAGKVVDRGADAAGGFRIGVNEAGERATRGLSITALIPSEAATGLSARMFARRSLRARGEDVTRENLQRETARYIDNLTTGQKTIATAMVNGFGEGGEEAVQAVLGATAFGETPTFRDVFEAARQGFAMGAGMGTAIGVQGRAVNDVYRERSNVLRELYGQAPVDDAQWNRMTQAEKAVEGTARSADEQKVVDLATKELRLSGNAAASRSIPEVQRAINVARQAVEQEASNSQRGVETSRLQTLATSYDWAPEDYVVSLDSAIRDVRARQAVLTKAAQQRPVAGPDGTTLSTTPQERERAAILAEADSRLLAGLEAAKQAYDQAPDAAARREVIDGVNRGLQTMWHERDTETAYGNRRAASVLAARYPLNAAGSFQLLRLQVSPQLTEQGNNWTTLVSDDTIVPQGGDYDGDRNSNLIRAMLPDDSYDNLRLGAGQLTQSGTMLDIKPFATGATENVYAALGDPGSTRHSAAVRMQGRVTVRLSTLLKRSDIPDDVVDELVGNLVDQLSSRQPEGLRALLTTLATQYAPQMRGLAEQLDASPYLRITRAVEDELREFETQSALRAPSTPSLLVELPEVSQAMPRWQSRSVAQTSDLLTATAEANSSNVFRVQTILKYNARREATETQAQEREGLLNELVRTFTALNDGIGVPGRDMLSEGTAVQRGTIDRLRYLVGQNQDLLGGHTANESLVLLAGLEVPSAGGDVTTLQALMRDTIDELRRKHALVLTKDGTLASKLSSLERLTQTSSVDEAGGRHAQSGNAFVEVLGAFPIDTLIGDQGAAVNTWTVRGLRDHLITLRSSQAKGSRDTRQEFEAALRAHPSYAETDGRPSPYRVLVDAVMQSAHQQLSEVDGLARGELTATSDMASANFHAMHDSLRKVANGRSTPLNSAADARSFLAADPALAARVLATMEARGLRASIRHTDPTSGTSRIEFPAWIYYVLAEPNTRQAEMIFLRNTLVSAYASLGTTGKKLDEYKVGDRILRLWLHLDYQANDATNVNQTRDRLALNDFVAALNAEGGTVDDFMRALNTDYRFRTETTPPFIPWARDRSVTDASRYGRGVSEVLEGTEVRDALKEAADAAAATLRQAESTREFLDRQENRELLDMLREARDNRDSVNRSKWTQFVAWVEFARDLPTMVSASIWIQQAGHINEILGNMGVKGISPDNVAPLGSAIAAQMPVFDAAPGRLIASATSGSLDDILTNAALIQSDRQIVLPDGTVVDWQGITPEAALDLLDNEATAGLAARALGMTAWDYNADTKANVMAAVVGTGVAGMTADPAATLFSGGTSAKLRRLMILESKISEPGGAPTIPVYLAQQMNVREAALGHAIAPGSPERERMAVSILEDLADLLQAASNIEGMYVRDGSGRLTTVVDEETDERMPLLNRALLTAARQARRDSRARSMVQKMLPENPVLRDAVHALLARVATKTAKRAFETDDPIAKIIAQRLTRDLNTVDETTSPLDVLVATYRDTEDPAVRSTLLTHLESFGDISRATPWAASAVARALDPQTSRVEIPLTAGTVLNLPDLTPDQWDLIARAVIAYSLHTNYGIAADSNLELTVFPKLTGSEWDAQRGYWDPTFVDLGVDMVMPGLLTNPAGAQPSKLLAAQMELVRDMGRELDPTSERRASDALSAFIAPRRTNPETGQTSGVTSQWHALLPALMHSAVGAVMSSATESGTQMAGINPARLRMLSATTKQDWTQVPPDDELSTTSVSAKALINAHDEGKLLSAGMRVTFPGGRAANRPLAQLEGRVAKKLVLTVPGREPISILGSARFGSGLLLPRGSNVPASQGGVIVMDTLAPSVTNALNDAGVPTDQWDAVTVDITFFHPETKAVSAVRGEHAYSHNPWFDGVNGGTDAAYSQDSLLGSFFFALDGEVPRGYERSLAAIKKLTFALQQVTTMPEAQRRAIADGGLTNMAEMIQRLTDFVLQQQIDGKPLGATKYNAISKFISLLYVVRTVVDGVPTVLSAEQVMARQQRGEPLGEHAEVVGLPLHFVLALMGERGTAVPTTTAYGDMGFTLDVSRARAYQDFPAAAWTDAMFGGLVRTERDDQGQITGWATSDLLAQPRLRNMSIPRPRVWGDLGSQPTTGRDFFSGFRAHQADRFAERAQVQGASTRWADQRATVDARVQSNPNVGQQVMQSVQLQLAGQLRAAAALSSPQAAPSAGYDLSTAWEYRHFGARSRTGTEGVLASDELSRVAFGDTVYVPADSFVNEQKFRRLEDALPEARDVLRQLMGFGATIVLPPSTMAEPLRSQMRRYLTEAGYVAAGEAVDAFEPVPSSGRTRAELAFHSSLRGAEHRTSQNRVPVSLSDFNRTNENSIMSVNGGLGAREDYFVREVVQTARYAGYAPPQAFTLGNRQDTARQQIIRILLPLIRTADGRQYLRETSGLLDLPTATAEDQARAAEAEADFGRALDDFQLRLEAAMDDADVPLLPKAGDEFGTGDIIPLASYNPQGELLGIHLYRHGHEPVDEELIAGGGFPTGNERMNTQGARLTIDRGTVDASHTTHRGVVVAQPEWLGLQGFNLQLRVKMADLGSKVFESLTGMKWTTTPAPENLPMPSHPLFNGIPVLGAGDLTSPTAKDSDGWWLNTPSQIAEVVGFDTMPALVRALTRVEYTEADAAEYASAEQGVREILRRFAFDAQSIGITAADVVTRDTDQLRVELLRALQRQLDETMQDAAPDLDVDLDDPAQRTADITMLRFVLAALATGAPLSEVASAPGYLQGATRSHTMHPVFTTLLHQLPSRHPAKQAFAEQINQRLARFAPSQNGVDRWELNDDLSSWTRYVLQDDGQMLTVTDMLAFPEIRNTAHNDALSEQARDRKVKASTSETANAVLYTAWDAPSLMEEPLTADTGVWAENPLVHTEQGRKALAFNRGTTKTPHIVKDTDDVKMNGAETRHIYTEALPAARALSVPIDDSRWYEGQNKATRRANERAYTERFGRVRRALKLSEAQGGYVEEMIRTVMGRPAGVGLDGETSEFLTYREAMAALKLIERNAEQGELPTRGGAANVVSRAALHALRDAGYPLRQGSSRRLADTWEQWVDKLLVEAFSADPALRGYPAVSNMIDGVLFEYRADVKGLPATVNNQLASVLKIAQTRNGLLFASPVQRQRADFPSVEGGREVYNATELAGQDWMLEDMPTEARAIIDQRMAGWEKRNGLTGRRRQSPRAEAIRGAQVREEMARTNTMMRFATLGVLFKTLVNPGLWISAFIELGVRGTQERAVSLLSGEAMGSRFSSLDKDQRTLWKATINSLADSPKFYQMVYENTNYQQAGGESGLEKRLQRVTNFASAMFNDPTWGTRATTMANRFMEAAWDAYQKMPLERHVSIEQFLELLSTNPDYLAQVAPEAVSYGYRRVEYARGLQDNLMARMVRRTTENIIGSGGPATNTLGVLLLRFPTLFFRFRSNTIINMMGLQAPHAIISTLLSDRSKRPGGLKDKLLGTASDVDPEVSDQAILEDSMDLTRAIIRSGVSHTQLFVLGSMISSAGLGGDEDDESRLIAKLQRYQQTPVAKDPLSLENDFRNAEAWFSDLLPAGMGVPTWIFKMFVTPAMGVARYNETGDFRQVYWGFMDALGSMPLLNVDNVLNSWTMANELSAAAESASLEDNVEATSNAQRLLVMSIGTLESMLFESAFASMIYQASDEWDRDPYAKPLRDSSGEIQREGVFNTPRATDTLQDIPLDEQREGGPTQGYTGRTNIDALLHGLAENRPVFGTVMSLIMRDSTYLRQNMPVKTREVKTEALDKDEAEQVLMSVLNNETGNEEVTKDGAEAIVRGIHLGALKLDSPALQNVFIPNDMREEIQTDFLAEMTEKYMTAGYSKSDALSNAKRDFYGQGYGEPEALGLADILWGDQIPRYQNQKYMQLNTTYVMGPNGRPIATGIQRSVLSALGINIVETYHDGTTGNLDVDQLLNSVDSQRMSNLGMRGLVKVDETWETPTAEEIGESINRSLDEISDQLDDIIDATGQNGYGYGNGWRNYGSGYRRFGRSGGYSRSYGGSSYAQSWGGQAQRLNTPRRIDSPYADDLYSINTSSPIIRRATIRRERFASQRGRLNQWQ